MDTSEHVAHNVDVDKHRGGATSYVWHARSWISTAIAKKQFRGTIKESTDFLVVPCNYFPALAILPGVCKSKLMCACVHSQGVRQRPIELLHAHMQACGACSGCSQAEAGPVAIARAGSSPEPWTGPAWTQVRVGSGAGPGASGR